MAMGVGSRSDDGGLEQDSRALIREQRKAEGLSVADHSCRCKQNTATILRKVFSTQANLQPQQTVSQEGRNEVVKL